MPTDGSGVYSLPAGYLATTGGTAVVTQHNPPLEDLATAMTARLPRAGTAPMTGPLKIIDGSVSAPGLAFNTSTGSGFYKTPTGFGLSVAGVLSTDFTSTGPVHSKTVTFKDGGDLASANALTLGDGNFFNITGTTAITSIGTKGVGTVVTLRFAASLTLTHNATDLALLSAANIVTRAGDCATFEEYAAGDWRMTGYHRADGTALIATTPRGYIDGCIISNGTDTTNDINIAAGVCRDSTNTVDIIVPALSGKQLDANWTTGGSAGMRNSAAGIADTTYHIYAGRTTASAVADIYAHTSADPTTVLTAWQAETGGSDYSYLRRIASIVRGGGAIRGFIQTGDRFIWKVPAPDVSATDVSSTRGLYALTVPLGIRVTPLGSFSYGGGGAVNLMLSNADQTETGPSVNDGDYYQSNTGVLSTATLPGNLLTDTSGRIGAIAHTGNSTSFDVRTHGYIDTRGKDA